MDALEFQDVWMDAQAEVQEVVREIVSEWSAPVMMQQMRLLWAVIEPELKEQFKREHPEDYANLVRSFGIYLGGDARKEQ